LLVHKADFSLLRLDGAKNEWYILSAALLIGLKQEHENGKYINASETSTREAA